MESNGKPRDLVYIPDGYTRWSYIEGVEGLHGPLKFQHRPMIAEEASLVSSAVNDVREKNKKEGDKRMAEVCAARILKWDAKRWDLKDHDAIPINAESIRHMGAELHAKLYLTIIGHRASDPIPDEFDEVEEDDWKAALAGTTAEEEAVKN